MAWFDEQFDRLIIHCDQMRERLRAIEAENEFIKNNIPDFNIARIRDLMNERLQLIQENQNLKVECERLKNEIRSVREGTLGQQFYEIPASLLALSIDDTDLSVRAWNALRRAGIQTIGDVAEYTERRLMKVENLGRKSMNEIKRLLHALNCGKTPTPSRGRLSVCSKYFEIYNARASGETLAGVGRKFSKSPERIRQICAKVQRILDAAAAAGLQMAVRS